MPYETEKQIAELSQVTREDLYEVAEELSPTEDEE